MYLEPSALRPWAELRHRWRGHCCLRFAGHFPDGLFVWLRRDERGGWQMKGGRDGPMQHPVVQRRCPGGLAPPVTDPRVDLLVEPPADPPAEPLPDPPAETAAVVWAFLLPLVKATHH